MKYIPHSEDCIWHFALRYALPRESGASAIVSDFLRENLSRIRPQTLRQMMGEINQAIAEGRAGQSLDVALWRGIADDIQAELNQ
jgi:hypothetical protein